MESKPMKAIRRYWSIVFHDVVIIEPQHRELAAEDSLFKYIPLGKNFYRRKYTRK